MEKGYHLMVLEQGTTGGSRSGEGTHEDCGRVLPTAIRAEVALNSLLVWIECDFTNVEAGAYTLKIHALVTAIFVFSP